MPYPDGVSAGTPNAPWNQEPAEECERCGGVYTDDGHETVGEEDEFLCYECDDVFYVPDAEYCPFCGTGNIGGKPCPNDGQNMRDLEDARKADAAEARYDSMKEDGRL